MNHVREAVHSIKERLGKNLSERGEHDNITIEELYGRSQEEIKALDDFMAVMNAMGPGSGLLAPRTVFLAMWAVGYETAKSEANESNQAP